MKAINRPAPYRLSPAARRLLEDVYRAADAAHGPRLVAHVAALSRVFTRDREAIGAPYLDQPALAAAYAAYFLPLNFAKVQAVLCELPPQGEARPTLSVLDIGAGLGTASLAAVDHVASRAPSSTHVDVVAIDQSAAALQEAARLMQGYRGLTGLPVRFTPVTGRLERMPAGCHASLGDGAPFDLIVAANSLNEPFSGPDALEARVRFLQQVLQWLAPDGSLVLIEPALRATTRDLHETRDQLLARGCCTVYSPCLHDRPCPALVRRDDWCHEERPWEPPPWITALDRRLGFVVKDGLKFSYVVLRKDGRTLASRSSDTYRVVSDLRVLKGEQRAWLCNERGRFEVGRLDRHASETNEAMDRWHRGAIVHIDQIVGREQNSGQVGLGRIPASGRVRPLSSVCEDQSASGSELPCW